MCAMKHLQHFSERKINHFLYLILLIQRPTNNTQSHLTYKWKSSSTKKWKDFHRRKNRVKWSGIKSKRYHSTSLEASQNTSCFHYKLYIAFKKFTNKYSRSMKWRKAKRDKREVKYNKAHCVLRLFLVNILGTRCLSRQKEGSGQWWVGMVRQAKQLSFLSLQSSSLF